MALSYDMQAVRELYEAYRSTDMWDLLQKGNAESWPRSELTCHGLKPGFTL